MLAMTENEQTIVDTIEGLKVDLRENGNLTIMMALIDRIEVAEGEEESLECSFIETEWSEGIYYHAPTHRFFFYGEPRTFSRGGRQWGVLITEDMLHLLPPVLKELLMEVARTRIFVTVPFNSLLIDIKK